MGEELKILGQGRYGFVTVSTNTRPAVALKYILASDKKGEDLFQRECKVLEMLEHPSIVEYYGVEKERFGNQDVFMISMEYCPRGSLRDILQKREIIYSMKTVLNWAEELLSALHYLNGKQFTHRDIKPENIFITDDFKLKLGDFGCLRMKSKFSSMSFAGTNRYISPEAYGARGKIRITETSDLYSTGLVLWEVIERRLVYSEYGIDNFNQFALFEDMKNGKYRLSPPDCIHPIAEIVAECTSFQYENRPEVADTYTKFIQFNLDYPQEVNQGIEIDANQTRLLRPIGFDGTRNRVELPEEIEGSMNTYSSSREITRSTRSSANGRSDAAEGSSSLKAKVKIRTKDIEAEKLRKRSLEDLDLKKWCKIM